MSSPALALVLLAAGASRRLGETKALVRMDEDARETVLELLLAAGAVLGDVRPLVVSGADHEPIAAHLRERLARSELELVRNERWGLGRTGSVQCAVAARPGRDLCLAPVDVPLVPRAVFAALATEWERRGRPARGWLAPSWSQTEGQGPTRRFGHPIVLGRELAAELKDFPPARPLHELRALAEPLLALEVACAAILDDLDTPEDLARLRARLRAGFPERGSA